MKTGLHGLVISAVITFLTMLFAYILIEIIKNLLTSYGFSSNEISVEYFYSQIFLALDNTILFYFLLNFAYMFFFGVCLSYVLTRHFSITAELIKSFLADPNDADITYKTSRFENKYALTRFIHLFFQYIQTQKSGDFNMDTVSTFLKEQKKIIFEKHVVIEILILFSVLMGIEIFLMNMLHTDLISGIYDFVIKSIVIDEQSSSYIDNQVYLFNSLSLAFIFLHSIVLLAWIYVLIRKIMNTNYGYLRVIKTYFADKSRSGKFVFISRNDDPTLECAKCFEDLFSYADGVLSYEK